MNQMNTALLALLATTTTEVVKESIRMSFLEHESALYRGREAVAEAKAAAQLAGCPACLALVDVLHRQVVDTGIIQELRAEVRELEFQLKQRDTPPGR